MKQKQEYVGTISYDEDYKKMVMCSISKKGKEDKMPKLFSIKLNKKQVQTLNKFLEVGDWLCATRYLKDQGLKI